MNEAHLEVGGKLVNTVRWFEGTSATKLERLLRHALRLGDGEVLRLTKVATKEPVDVTALVLESGVPPMEQPWRLEYHSPAADGQMDQRHDEAQGSSSHDGGEVGDRIMRRRHKRRRQPLKRQYSGVRKSIQVRAMWSEEWNALTW